jgi:hypothetical protein
MSFGNVCKDAAPFRSIIAYIIKREIIDTSVKIIDMNVLVVALYVLDSDYRTELGRSANQGSICDTSVKTMNDRDPRDRAACSGFRLSNIMRPIRKPGLDL